MNEIKKCSISGIAFILEKEAYTRINGYIDSLKRAYKDNPDSSEIIADIEARVAELILSAQRDPEQVVCLPLIENIIAQLGSVEDISESQSSGSEPTTETRIPRRLYRDLENNKLGGVCAGLGKYFDIDPVWMRLVIFSPIVLVPVSSLSNLGLNLFTIMVIIYLILWFAVPQAKSARQKLEMEGEAVTVKSIADRQVATTDEERAKSSVATFIAGLGRFAVICLKAFMFLLMFPLISVFMVLIFTLFAAFTGAGVELLSLGNLGTLAEAIDSFGTALPVLTVIAVLIPIAVILYLLVALIIGSRPRWWVLISSLIIWILLAIGVVTKATSVVSGMHENEVERILKSDWDDRAIDEPLDSLEYNRLLNDPNAAKID